MDLRQIPIAQHERRRPRRAAYALPSMFTSANIFFGFISVIQAIDGAVQARLHPGDPNVVKHFSDAAKALGFAVCFDFVDGFVARLTNTASDFGRELDSLADVITFGIAPAVLVYVWGAQFIAAPTDSELYMQITRAGYLVAFFYLLCGAVRLARFNVQTNPTPKNPGRPDRKYFVGMPIPAGAAMVASLVFLNPSPIQDFRYTILWLALICAVALLMVSTWRYPSFKQLGISKPRSPLVVIAVAVFIYLLFTFPQQLLLALASAYVASGIAIRFGGIVRRLRRGRTRHPALEQQ